MNKEVCTGYTVERLEARTKREEETIGELGWRIVQREDQIHAYSKRQPDCGRIR